MNVQEYFDSVDPDCTGCGFCCIKTKCWVGQRIYPGPGVCQALEWNGERHVCALMQSPGKLGENYREELHAGAGCCAGLNSWKREPLQNRIPTKETYVNPIPSIMQIFLAALGKEMIGGDALWLACSHFRGLLVKDGMDEKDAEHAASRCLEYIVQQRSGWKKEFMG